MNQELWQDYPRLQGPWGAALLRKQWWDNLFGEVTQLNERWLNETIVVEDKVFTLTAWRPGWWQRRWRSRSSSTYQILCVPLSAFRHSCHRHDSSRSNSPPGAWRGWKWPRSQCRLHSQVTYSWEPADRNSHDSAQCALIMMVDNFIDVKGRLSV